MLADFVTHVLLAVLGAKRRLLVELAGSIEGERALVEGVGLYVLCWV